jgi:hypothetical protein
MIWMDTDHRGLNKFSSHNDPNYAVLRRVLRKAYDHAVPTQVSGEHFVLACF